MRSYYDHLMKEEGEAVFRSSALFPVIITPHIFTRLLFLGYWKIKSGIDSLGCVISLRSKEGELVKRNFLTINKARAYRVEAKDFIQDAFFEGSIEIEFFSSKNLVFPYPAVVVNYYGPEFSSVVHTAQRVYNNFEDREQNSQSSVREAGFNIYHTHGITPFVSFVNGPVESHRSSVEIEVINHRQEKLFNNVIIGSLKPYEMKILYLNDYFHLENFLSQQAGTCKLKLDLDWVFPRFIAGNRQTQPEALSITHTYYDTSESHETKDFWHEKNEGFFPASLMVPIDAREERFTSVYFYPVYSSSPFALDIEIFNSQGNKLAEQKEALLVVNAFSKIEFKEILKKFSLPLSQPYGARLSATGDKDLPARIKIGLDIGSKNTYMPCNLCTNLQPYNPKLITKKKSFKWAPLLANSPHSFLWIMNSSPEIDYKQEARLNITFYREKDEAVMEKNLILPPQGFAILDSEDLRDFLEGHVGWAAIASDNPMLTTYYGAISPSGIIGGDHGF